jgi:hypothetical protein
MGPTMIIDFDRIVKAEILKIWNIKLKLENLRLQKRESMSCKDEKWATTIG